MIDRITPNTVNAPSFGHSDRTNMNRKQKTVVAASAIAGMTPVIMVLAKKKGFSLNPKNIIGTPIKDWAIFKYSPAEKAIDFGNPVNIIATALGSVAGGFVGGSIVDKQNVKAKKREVLNQILGNVLVPITTVWLGSKVFNKYQYRLEEGMPQINSLNNSAKIFNKILKKIPQAVATLAALGVGIFLGNKVSNYINEKIYHKKVDRNIRATDFAPHVDDICMATTMMSPNSTFGQKLGKIIPLALVVPGYQTGIAQDIEA
jgi:predicted MFS family arabinose efflux permease